MSEALDSALLAGDDDVAGDQARSVGAALRAARESRQLGVGDVAQRLKLGVRQIEALENGDWSGLPGSTFVRGFVRNYARMLGIESDALLTRLDATLAKPVVSLDIPESASGSMPAPAAATGRRDRSFILLGIVLALLAGVAYLMLPNDLSALRDRAQGLLDAAARRDEKAPVAPTVAKDAAPEPVFPPGQSPQQVMNPQLQALPQLESAKADAGAPAAAGALRLAFTGESWVEVRDRDGKVLFSEKRAAGGDQSLDGAPPLALVIGKASAVTLTWRGKPVDLAPHTKGEVARLTLE
ncbi:MAG: helix-turn-helix domain-containing protein [Betaproteobacteria bacterium]|nr:helix-turn-helix domain-containing protein [Betaproteobacteria bacterium]